MVKCLFFFLKKSVKYEQIMGITNCKQKNALTNNAFDNRTYSHLKY